MVKTLPSNATGAGLISSQGAKLLCALQPKNKSKETKRNQYSNKFDKDFLNGLH